MGKKQTKLGKVKIIVIVIASVFVVTSAVLATYIMLHRSSHRSNAYQTTIPFATSPFTFNEAAAPDWWRGGAQDVSKDKDSYITLFTKHDESCFVDINKHSGVSDEATELQKAKAHVTDKSNLELHSVGTSQAVLKTGSQEQLYSLNPFSISGVDHMMRGVEFGYIQFPNYYLLVQGWCSIPEQLGSIMAALGAITFMSRPDGN